MLSFFEREELIILVVVVACCHLRETRRPLGSMIFLFLLQQTVSISLTEMVTLAFAWEHPITKPFTSTSYNAGQFYGNPGVQEHYDLKLLDRQKEVMMIK